MVIIENKINRCTLRINTAINNFITKFRSEVNSLPNNTYALLIPYLILCLFLVIFGAFIIAGLMTIDKKIMLFTHCSALIAGGFIYLKMLLIEADEEINKKNG